MDNMDIRILRMLKENSRQSMSNIAQGLGISKATVSRRISRMEEEGIISGFTVSTDITKMGGMRAIMLLEISGSSLSSVVDDLAEFEEIEYIHKLFGDHSLLCEIYVSAVDSLYELIQNKIMTIPNVKNVEVDIMIERIAAHPEAELNFIASSGPLSK